MPDKQQIDFSGKMVLDVAPEKMNPVDYGAAHNIQFLSDNESTTGKHIPMKGAIPAFDLGSVAAQNKIWRLFTTNKGVAGWFGAFNILDMNGKASLVPSAILQVYFDQNQSVTLQATSIQSQLNTIYGAGNSLVTTDGLTYIDITIIYFFAFSLPPTSTSTGYDWGILAVEDPTSTTPTSPAMSTMVVQEAYDISLAGELHDIESNDLLGDLYVWSTPQTHLPEAQTLTVSSVTNGGALGRFQIQFTAAHNLISGQKISISGSNTAIDGIWMITVINITTIKLESFYANYSVVVGTPFDVTVTTYLEGVGEIGVAVYDENSDVWTYTRIGRTKEWNFRTKKQPQAYCEQTAVKSSIYWINDFGVPRVIYYIFDYDANGNRIAFVTDGILSFINSSGLYSYNTIEQESRLQLSATGVKLTFLQQLQSGGAVASGNWRYALRFLSESLTATETGDLTNPINVYSAPTNASPARIIGDEANTITTKINQLQADGIPPGLFKYVELIGVNYVGDAIVGYVIRRELLSSTDTSIVLSHTGTETDVSNFDLGLLSQVFENISTAKSIDVIDKRMILSNITTQARIDFSEWAQAFTHNLFKKSITSVTQNSLGSLRFGEYQDPQNVNNFVGYMQNETYRFGVKVRFKKGGWSPVFHVDDVIFNTDPTNIASTDPTRRTAGLTDFNLTDSIGGVSPNCNTTVVYVPAIEFTNINLDVKIEGTLLRDLIDGFSIERAEVANPTILACGYVVPSIKAGFVDDAAGVERGFTYTDTVSWLPIVLAGAATGIGEYPFISGRVGGPSSNPLYTAAEFVALGRDKRVMAFHSPDIQFGHTSITFASGDKLLNHGNPIDPNFTAHTSAGNVSSQYGRWTGFFNTSGVTANVIKINNISQVAFIDTNSDLVLTSGKTYRKRMALFNAAVAVGDYSVNHIFSSPVIETTSDLDVFGTQSNYGFCYAQYNRAIADQYGKTETTKYITCGHLFEILPTQIGAQSTQIFGGDTFTQQNYFRQRGLTNNGVDFPGFISPVSDTPGFGGGVSFYCQNKINAQMKSKFPSQVSDIFPAIAAVTWLESIYDATSEVGNNSETYQEGYTIRNQVKSDVAFDPDIEQQNDFPARIVWSAIKLQGGASDQYRVYLPLNFHDLDQTFGEIRHHANAKGELVTWQDRAFMRQYFNTRGTLQVKGITEILIGDSSVMNRDGVTMSRFGSLNKWGIIKGTSRNGDDVYMWINSELKNVSHYASNGTLTVSDEGVKSFFANNLTWINRKDSPADLEGIHGVYDQRYNNFIFTVRGKNTSFDKWDPLTFYGASGIKVYYSSDPFNIIGDVYESLLTSTGSQPDLFPLLWKKLSNANGEYFNQYTMVFNGYKTGFICSAAFAPKIYNKWQNTFLSPRYVSPEYKLYLHNKGAELTWYDYLGVSLQEKAYITGIINKHPELTKWATAIGIDCDLQPDSMDFETKLHKSFLTTTEFEYYEESWFSPVKEDSTTSGVNDGNTSLLWGKYLKAKFNFAVGIPQRLSNFIVKFEISRILK